MDGEVVALFWGDDVRAILALEDGLGAVFEEFGEAFDGDGDEDAGFGFGGGDVEGDVVEVGDDLVDGGWCCAGDILV